MVASTDVKFFVQTNNNAPQLTNNFGCMLGVLDAVLINGIQIGTVNSLTTSGKMATAVFGAAHNLMQYQVVKIAGANQAEYNVEARILTVPNATTITFELAFVPSVAMATGTINASLPSLGWEKPFSSTSATGGKGAYRSKNLLLPSRPFLRVVDELDPAYIATYAKYAKVGIVEDMTDINTMLGVQAPYDSANPDKNWIGTGSGASVINGWSRWYYARSQSASTPTADSTQPSAGNRPYIIVGNGDYFYILNSHTSDENTSAYAFGSFDSSLETDNSCTFLNASLNTSIASSSNFKGSSGILSTLPEIILFRKYDQSAAHSSAAANSLNVSNSNTQASGYSNYIAATANAPNIPFSPAILNEGGVIRGVLPCVNWLFQALPFANLAIVKAGNEVFIAKNVAPQQGWVGQILLNVGRL